MDALPAGPGPVKCISVRLFGSSTGVLGMQKMNKAVSRVSYQFRHRPNCALARGSFSCVLLWERHPNGYDQTLDMDLYEADSA